MTEHPVHIPRFLESYPIGFTYSRDVSRTIASLIANYDSLKEKVENEAFNLAFPTATNMLSVLNEIKEVLNMDDLTIQSLDEHDHLNHFYTYPSTRSGPMNVAKAADILQWNPTNMSSAIEETVQFFEDAMTSDTFVQQRDEIIQVVGNTLFGQNLIKFYEALETLYGIDLKHFKYPRDEL